MIPDRINRSEARVIAEEEFRRFAALMASLNDDEWTRPTDCTEWDVRKVALHVLGAADAQASMKEFVHQFVRGMPVNKQIESHHFVDGLNELQIRERSGLSNPQIVEQLTAIGPRAVKARWSTPWPMRYMPIKFGEPVGWRGWAPLKYLLDLGWTRDIWAHRVDICEATGRPMQLTPEHDGRLVGDIVAEWATIYGQPFELVLDGPAGGKYSYGFGGERVEISATDFVRVLSGRLPAAGVLANPLPL